MRRASAMLLPCLGFAGTGWGASIDLLGQNLVWNAAGGCGFSPEFSISVHNNNAIPPAPVPPEERFTGWQLYLAIMRTEGSGDLRFASMSRPENAQYVFENHGGGIVGMPATPTPGPLFVFDDDVMPAGVTIDPAADRKLLNLRFDSANNAMGTFKIMAFPALGRTQWADAIPVDRAFNNLNGGTFGMGSFEIGSIQVVNQPGLHMRPRILPPPPPILRVADGNFTWNGPSEGTWQQNSNWIPSSGFPDGTNAIANITNLNGGGVIQLNGSITLSQLNLSDPQIASLAGPISGAPQTMTMAGDRTINTTNFAREDYPATGRFFGTAFGLPASAPNPARPIVIGGTNGLIVTGGPIAFRGANSYVGNTTISGGARVSLLNQVSLNSAFGTAGDIHLDNGQIWVEVDNGSLSRNIVVAGGGGNLSLGTDPGNVGTSTHTFSGVISGAGSLLIDGDFGGIGNFTGANTHSGVLNVGLGTHVLSGNGAFAASSAVNNAGTLVLSGGGANRLPDAATLTMHGASLRMNGYNGTETIGPVTLRGGTSNIIMQGGNGTLSAGDITRASSGALEIQANALGTGNRILFSNGTAQLVNGVFRYAFGHAQDPFTVGIESNLTELMTYGATGVTPISAAGGYAENAFTAGTSVRLQSTTVSQTFMLPAGTTNINSLVLAPGFDGGGNGINGIFVVGPGTLSVDAGVILSSTSGFTVANVINSGIGNTISADVTITTTGSELILACPGALTTFGKITGNISVTKTGIRTWFNNSTTSDYTGQTVLSGFNRHKGNLPLNAPGAYGNASSEIVLDLNNRIQNDPGLGATGIFGASFGPDAGQGATSMNRPLRVRGNAGRELIGALIRNFSTGTFTMNGQIIVEPGARLSFQSLNVADQPFVVNGNIAGEGHVSLAQTQATLQVTINGTNTFSGGFDHDGGTLTVGSDTALGLGVYVSGGALTNSIQSVSGPRVLANDLLLSSATLSVQGTNPISFSGNVFAQGGLLDIVAGNNATFSGNLTHGDLFKTGPGTLHLTGNNTIDGQINAGNGTVPGGMIVMRSNNAAGSSVGATAANFGENTIALDGDVTVGSGELMVLRGDGVGGLGNLRSLCGDNTWNGSVVVQQQNSGSVALTTRGSIGIDGGTLTIVRSISTSATASDGSPAQPLGVRKVGLGTLHVGGETFLATPGGTSTFQGSIVASGSLEIAEGTMRVLPSSGLIDVPALFIAGGPNDSPSTSGSPRARTPQPASTMALAAIRTSLDGSTDAERAGSAAAGSSQGSAAGDPVKPGSDVASRAGELAVGGSFLGTLGHDSVCHCHVTATVASATAPTARLDLTNNAMVIDYTGPSPLQDTRSYIVSGYAGGAWTGNGITTSSGNAAQFGLGYGDNVGGFGGLNFTTFFGDPVDNSTVLVAWTRYGDADLNRLVNLADFNRLAANFGLASGAVWTQGDFDYNGRVNLNDFNRLAANFGLIAGPEGPTPADWAALASAVPEPAVIGPSLLLMALLPRRRRR